MDNPIAFAVTAAALLLVPGPTNSLIATIGAVRGVRGAVRLLPAELCGYLLAILGWGLGFAALGGTASWVGWGAKIVASLVLIHAAWDLWFAGSITRGRATTGLRNIFVVTLSNPKGLIFALTIVPYLKDGDVGSAIPYLSGLAVLIVTIGTCWALAGATLAWRLSTTVSHRTFARIGAVAMLGFATSLVGNAFASIIS